MRPDTVNVNRAAEQRFVSQPALTRAVQKLEGELGGLLFSRQGRRTRLTDLGHLMRQHLTEVAALTSSKAQRERAVDAPTCRNRIGAANGDHGESGPPLGSGLKTVCGSG